MNGSNLLLRLCQNELEKLWTRRRWVLVAVVVLTATFGLIEAIAARHNESWQDRVQGEIQQLHAVKENLQRGQGVVIGQGSGQTIDVQIAQKEYQLSRNIAPADWHPLGKAATITFLQMGLVFVLVFGWLAAELVAQERSERTINLLLSRPVSRSQVLGAKGLALFAAAVATLLAAAVLTFVIAIAADRRLGSLTSGTLLFNDPSAPQTDVVILPLWLYAVITAGLTILALLVAEGLGMLLSTLSRGPGVAIGATVGILAILPGLANLLGGMTPSSGWLQLFFFSHLTTASRLASGGFHATGTAVLVLLGWSALFYITSALLFRQSDELA